MSSVLTTGVLLTIIICLTCVILAMIGVLYARVKSDKEDCRKWTYIYSSSVIVFITITIVSYMFHGSDKVLDFTSLASSIISIILAVITIIFSFYTNNRSSGQVEKLNDAADKVESAASLYQESATALNSNIRSILATMSTVEKNTDMLLGMNMGNINREQNSMNKKSGNVDINHFVKSSSAMGKLALYIAMLAKDYTCPMPLTFVETELDQAYCAGFIICASSLGLLQANVDLVNEELCVIVDDYNNGIKKLVIDFIESVIGDKENPHYALYRETKKNIDSFIKKNKLKVSKQRK